MSRIRASLFEAEDWADGWGAKDVQSAEAGSALCPVGSESPEPALSSVRTGDGSRKVLLLEDDPAQLMLLEQHLGALGLKVVKASTIAEARQRLTETRVELALFDIQLPDGSG
ncbi:MAG: response regulator, partial [Planctomycetota bacterium]